MRDGWEAEAQNWARFARTPGLDRAHRGINLPALRDLLPAPGRRTLDLGCGEGRLTALLSSLGHRVVGIDAAPTMVRLAAGLRWRRIPLFLHVRAVKPGPGYRPAAG